MTATCGDGGGATTSGASARFADYFAVVGLDLSSGLEPDTLSGDNLHVAPLSRPYKCAVLNHFPESVPNNPFDAKSVALLCCPRGLSFTTDRIYSPSVSPKPRDKDFTFFHTFLITKEDGSRIYGSTITFYEEVRDRSICAAMQTLHAMHLAELANSQSKTLYYNIDPFNERTPPPTLCRRSRRPSGAESEPARDVDSDLYDVGKLLGHLEDSLIEYDAKSDKLFVTKTICLITQLPFFNACRSILEQIHSSILNDAPPKLPIESYVYNALFEVPLPPPGRSMKFFSVTKPIFCQRPSSAELPLFDLSFTQLFLMLGMENLVQLFTCACLETQILLHSTDYQRLMLVAEGICALLFPFTWQHVYVPILPASLHHFLDAPVPFIMGLRGHKKGDGLHDDDRGPLQDLPQEASMCFVDIDQRSVNIPEDLPVFPDQYHFLREIQEAFRQFDVTLEWAEPENENNNSHLPQTSGPRDSEGNVFSPRPSDDGSGHVHDPDQYSSNSHRQQRNHPSQLTEAYRLGSKSTNDLKNQVWTASLSDENHPEGAWQDSRGNTPSPRMISGRLSRQNLTPQQQQRVEVLEKSEAMARITAIVKRAGVLSDFDLDKNKLVKDLSYPEGLQDVEECPAEAPPLRRKAIISSDWPLSQLRELRVNNAVRQIFFNRFVHLFRTYENFVIHPGNEEAVNDFETWLSNRDQMQNFDKTAFLSDQPQQVLPFLSRFIETQMFTTLIDNKIMMQWIQSEIQQSQLTPDPFLVIFDARIKVIRDQLGEEQIRASRYEPCTCILETELPVEKRADVINHVAPKPRILPWLERREQIIVGDELTELPLISTQHEKGFFPNLNPDTFVVRDFSSVNSSLVDPRGHDPSYHLALPHHKPKRRDSAKWRRKDRQMQHSEHLQLTLDQREKYVSEARVKAAPGARDPIKYASQNPKLSDLSPAVIAQTNWKFVETLLKEAKAKTKRMLVAKMGHEAVELGHGDVSLTGVEENTLIVALCDLLERIWSHGLQTKHGKSALWSHLLAFQEMRRSTVEDPEFHSTDMDPPSADGSSVGSGSHRSARRRRSPRPKVPPLMSPAGYAPPPHRTCASAPTSAHSSPASDKPPYSPVFYGGPSRDGTPTGQPDTQRGSSSGYHRGASPSIVSGTSTTPRNSRRARASSRSASTEVFGWRPLPNTLEADMLNVQGMSEIRTEIGFARAWVRLALEKKLLSSHLKALMSGGSAFGNASRSNRNRHREGSAADSGKPPPQADHETLLQRLYKRYAFLRSEDEREQLLFHLLSLNAVDFFCFTNTFTSTFVTYRLVIFPSRKFHASSTSANIYVCVSGTLGDTGILPVPRGSLELQFRHKNLGILTSLRIGHDNSGMAPRCQLEHVLVRNEITGHVFKFPCGRWLGKGVDDGSTERLLVGDLVPHSVKEEELFSTCKASPRARSPSVGRSGGRSPGVEYVPTGSFGEVVTNVSAASVVASLRNASGFGGGVPLTNQEIEEWLGDACNNIIKYFHKMELQGGGRGVGPGGGSIIRGNGLGTATSSTSLTHLLCSEDGLIPCLEMLFQSGLRSSRIPMRKVYVWDVFEKVKMQLETLAASVAPHVHGQRAGPAELQIAQQCLCRAVGRIAGMASIGKDGKFQQLMCIGARDHLLHQWIPLVANSSVTATMYESTALLRDPQRVTFIIQILCSLLDFNISLEPSLLNTFE